MCTQKIKVFLQLCVGGVLGTIIGLLIVLSAPVYILRRSIMLLAQCTRADFDNILVPISAILAGDLLSGRPPRFTCVTTMKLQGEITLNELKSHVTRNWIEACNKTSEDLVYKRFRQYPQSWMGFLFWKNAAEKFNLDEHIHYNENLGLSEDNLTAFQEKLLNEPFPSDRSPWDLHIIANYKNPQVSTDPMFCVTFKYHHCLADGYSILACLFEGLLECPLANLTVPGSQSQYTRPTILQYLAYYVAVPFTAAYSIIYAISTTLLHPNSWRVPSGQRSWRQIVTKLEPIPTSRIKEIRNKFGVAFSAVLISAITTALRRTWKGMSEDEYGSGSTYFICPQPLPGHTLRLTNHYTAVGFGISTTFSDHSQSVAHLKDCNTRLNNAKRSGFDLLIRLGFSSLGSNLLSVIKLCTKLNKFSPIVLASLPGPDGSTQVDMVGRRLLAVESVVGTLDGHSGVGITVVSYGRYTQLCLIADPAVMSRVELNHLNKFIVEEINILYDAA